MQFKRTEELRTGMRIARPIYNKNGVLLYERNSKLTEQGVSSIKNFGLIGLFILEPAEPVPPMTRDDIEFERFQTMCVFAIQEELERITRSHKSAKIQNIVNNIIRNYGHLDKKINFIQNLRSKEDYIYKHSLNVAVLCAMIGHRMNLKIEERLDLVTAAIVHDIGKFGLPRELLDKNELNAEDNRLVRGAIAQGHILVENVFLSSPGIRRICSQMQRMQDDITTSAEDFDGTKMVTAARILLAAETFDTMTAMQLHKLPASEVVTIKYLMEHPEWFDQKIVSALIESVNILIPGVSVELNTGDKALVLVENRNDILRPMVLCFHDNSILDLSNRRLYGDIQIVDIMKTMDNRYIMNIDELIKQGFATETPEFV